MRDSPHNDPLRGSASSSNERRQYSTTKYKQTCPAKGKLEMELRIGVKLTIKLAFPYCAKQFTELKLSGVIES